eukprot:scaffold7579_cov63-Phaeocystis_antarctica.AAC.1
MSKWGRGQPRTVPDFRVLAAAVNALVVDAGGRLDGGGGDDNAVLGREEVEAQHHRSQNCESRLTGVTSYGSTGAHSGRWTITAAPFFTVWTNLMMSCGAGLGSSSLPVSSRHCSSSDFATVSATSPR